MKKIILVIVGCIGVGLGALGAVLPILPAFPFLLLAAVCFAKSSDRLDGYFGPHTEAALQQFLRKGSGNDA